MAQQISGHVNSVRTMGDPVLVMLPSQHKGKETSITLPF